MKIVNKKEFEEITKDGYTLVDFYADWCGPCKMLAPVLEKVSVDYENVDFIKVNVDQEEELASKYKIMSIPAVFILKDGEIIAKTGGMQPEEAIRQFISNALK